ncbi:MAG: 50S ribosomal protein L13 [Verrucomicrobiae bacterium]|nr:50S ribosomal protein L13 [Verrucomicrobiae bacterium]
MKRALTTFKSKETAKPRWFLIDAEGRSLGRVAVAIANIVRGKNTPAFTPHADAGDFVVVINAAKVRLTGKKEVQKTYMTFSRFVGGHKSWTAKEMRERHPELLIERAVKGMVPHTRLGRVQLRKVKVYPGAEHPHAAQNLEPLKIAA